MKLCPSCHRCYEDSDLRCAELGHLALVAARPGRTRITEKYQLDRLLGRGGMGAVYAGTHVELDRPVAIKLLLPQLMADAGALERFRREARAAARINHSNVAGVYDFGLLPDGEAYLVMELVEGQTLREYLNALGQFPFDQAVGIAEQVAGGIEAAHRQDVIHRDLKPSNIILNFNERDARWVAKVVDFGIAKLREQGLANDGSLTASGAFIGTPRYMSPEQCLGAELDARADIYSLGVILYEMLAGAPPFDASTAMAVALKHVGEAPPPVARARPQTPAALASLTTKLLQKAPAARPQNAGEVARRLREIENSPELRTAAALENEESEVLTPDADLHEPAQATPISVDMSESVGAASRQTLSGHAPTFYDSAPGMTPPDLFGEEIPFALAEEGETVTRVVPPKKLPPAGGTGEDEPLAVIHPPPTAELIAAPLTARQSLRRWQNLSPLVYAVIAFVLVFGLGLTWLRWRQTPPANQTDNLPPRTDARRDDLPTADEPRAAKASPGEVTPTPGADRQALLATLDQWVQATNQRDVAKQGDFYMPRLAVFYLQRGVTRADVLAEKERLFRGASPIKIGVADVHTTLARNNRFAFMRFRKEYEIGERSGEVWQELKWEKTAGGWKITSERD
ncbi:MAG TPA: protein kinase, partial [Pyrinomonadaceae bacterium]|nr:protein kinase [Pyrinomonadaceae bacterium]